MATATVKPGVEEEEKSAHRRSSGARLSTLFDVGVRSTGQFDVATQKEAMSFREVILLFCSMIINALPAILIGIIYALYQGWVIRHSSNAVLDVLEDQPMNWAAEGFDYKAYTASDQLGYGKRMPPGVGPFNGTNVTYGGRADWDGFADVPSMSFRLLYNGYHQIGMMGHPVVSTGYLWLANSFLFLARPGLLGISALLVQALFGGKIKGKYSHVILWVYGVVVMFLLDYYCDWDALHTGRPRGENGTFAVYGPLAWWLYHSYLMWSTAKYGYQLQGAARGVAMPVFCTVFIGLGVQGIFWNFIDTVKGKSLLILRLLVWPCITELITAPCRAMLRSIPDEWADKSSLSFGMIPPVVALASIGRLVQYKIVDPTDMVICNFVLFVVELVFRLSVAHRDRFYARLLGCMSSLDVKHLFTQKNNVKFRCDNLINEMVIEYWAMLTLFIQSYALNRKNDPGAPTSAHILVANLLLQFFLELICDTVCLYIEDTKLKAPVLKAWMGRKKNYPLFFGALLLGAGMYASIGPLFSVCPMRNPEDGSFMGVSCVLNDGS